MTEKTVGSFWGKKLWARATEKLSRDKTERYRGIDARLVIPNMENLNSKSHFW